MTVQAMKHFHRKLHLLRNASRLVCAKRGIAGEQTSSVAKESMRVFSGIQPTGVPHIGNYIGAIQRWVKLQNEYSDVIFSIVDLHSITLPQKPAELRENIQILAACLLACGIDPNRSILFQQSEVPYHAELGWILNCQCTVARLKGLPHWNEKSVKVAHPSVGLLAYPVLQAADILLYKSNLVPVGEDQVHHIGLARHLANFFNNTIEKIFPVPEISIGETPRIKNLKEPLSKMSKSDMSAQSYITLLDSDDDIAFKIRRAKTDFTSAVTYDVGERPGVSNLIEIHSAFSGKTPEEICQEATGLETGKYKSHVSDAVIEKIRPIREEANRLLNDRTHLGVILKDGKERATEIAQKTMTEVRHVVGFS